MRTALLKSATHLLLPALLLAGQEAVAQATLYVAPTGTTANPGTLAAPTTLERAITAVTAGGTIYMRGGTYTYSTGVTIAFGNNGSKRIEAYAGEVPVLNFSGQATADANRGLTVNGNNWYIKGLVVERAGDNGIYVGGSSCTFELCTTRFNKDTGLQLGRYSSSAPTSAWPANNLILNCTSHDNQDPTNENADGFACKLTTGNGNVFRGCIAHHNIDDGWDLYAKTDTGPIGPVTIEECVAYANGALSAGSTSGSGDKNGFKLGGSGIAVAHVVRRSVAFGNGHHGFTDNDNPGPISVTNNTSFDNDVANYSFRAGGTHVFTNNLSFQGTSSDVRTGTLVGNSNVFWVSGASSNGGGLVVSAADFVSVTAPASVGRDASGAPALGSFLALAAGSDLIDAGVTATGITYSGTAPDLGARESGAVAPPASYMLTTTASPSAGGTITRSPNAATYAAGTVVSLTAAPAAGYTFAGWSGDASGSSATTTVTMSANATATATFTQNPPSTYTLTVSSSPAAGGSVVLSPAGSSYAAGTVVTATATPAAGYTFTGWSGASTATTAGTTVTMDANKTLTATFTATGGGGSTTLRIEDAAATGNGYCGANGSRQSSFTGADNGFYINLSNSSAQGIDWKVSVPAAGSYTLRWRYANAGSGSATTARVLVNGATAVASVAFPKTITWSTWTTTTATVSLPAGVSAIRLETTVSSEFANIDWIEVVGNSPTAAACTASRSAATTSSPAKRRAEPAQLYPNPVAPGTVLALTLAQESPVALQLYNSMGQLVKSVAEQVYPAGQHAINIEASGLKFGSYLLIVVSKEGKQSLHLEVQ
jgi:uncharacterized repeat protein (TIGR02543 family)